MERLNNVKLSLDEDESLLKRKAAKLLGISENKIKYLKIIRKSVDARRNDVHFCYTLDVDTAEVKKTPAEVQRISTERNIGVVGLGPAGLFCALTLVRHGFKVTVFERGEDVDKRTSKVKNFLSGGELDLNTNVQFGEGGAGTFSDGKLNTQINNRLVDEVLKDFVRFGAPDEIAYISKPHIGSDNLKNVVKNIRNEIISLGGEVKFNCSVEDFEIKNGALNGIVANGKKYSFDAVVLAVGHSARDTFERLFHRGVFMEQKEFAVGVRCEQLQSVIDKVQYGRFAGHPKLKPADFKLVSHKSERSAFTFCMCPGGVVIPAASETGGVVVNGMSNYLRNEKNANSAIIAQVRKSDFPTDSPLAGVEFQRSLERKAFALGGGNYSAPVQLASDFICGRKTVALEGVEPSYSRNYNFAELDGIFPQQISDALKSAVKDMDGKLPGIGSYGAVLTGVESRTSSPLRIVRNENSESVNVKGLFPSGEGCGYAGGIMSAAVDGIKVANDVFRKFTSAQV